MMKFSFSNFIFSVSVLEKIKYAKVRKKGRGVPCIVYIGCFCTFLSFCFWFLCFCFSVANFLESSLFSFCFANSFQFQFSVVTEFFHMKKFSVTRLQKFSDLEKISGTVFKKC